MGIDKNSKGIHVYWPDKHNVTVEQNVYVDKTGGSNSHLKGEVWDGFIETKIDEPIIQNSTVPPSHPKNSKFSLQSDIPSSDIPPVLVNEDPNSGSDTPLNP